MYFLAGGLPTIVAIRAIGAHMAVQARARPFVGCESVQVEPADGMALRLFEVRVTCVATVRRCGNASARAQVPLPRGVAEMADCRGWFAKHSNFLLFRGVRRHLRADLMARMAGQPATLQARLVLRVIEFRENQRALLVDFGGTRDGHGGQHEANSQQECSHGTTMRSVLQPR